MHRSYKVMEGAESVSWVSMEPAASWRRHRRQAGSAHTGNKVMVSARMLLHKGGEGLHGARSSWEALAT